MVGAIFLVTHLLFGTAAAIPVALLAGLLIAGLWYAYPFGRART